MARSRATTPADEDDGFDQAFGDWGEEPEEPAAAAPQVQPSEAPSTSQRLNVAPETDGHACYSSNSHFAALPKEVMLRVLCFLSASDLACIAACSRQLLGVASEDVLWRRLFCARWGKPKAQPVAGAALLWKGQYADADAEECVQTVLCAPEELRAVFRDMQRAKRQTCLGRLQLDDIAEVPRCHRQRQLAEWRRQRGFGDGPVARPDLSSPTLRFHRLDHDTFACEETGWAHTCDHGCCEGIIDAESGLITCPVSGRTSQRLMAPHEERSMQQRSVDACFAAADQELQSFSVARAYTDGYYADARELRRKYGVRLR